MSQPTNHRRFGRLPHFEDLCALVVKRGCHVGLIAGTELQGRETHPHRELTDVVVSEKRTLLARVPITAGRVDAAALDTIHTLGWA